MVDDIGSLFNQSTAQTETKGKTSLGKDDFMNLLITQLKYQDPVNPMEGAEFASQLAEFSSLEQLANLNDAIHESIDTDFILTQSINNTMTASLIGKEVKLAGALFNNSGQDQVSLGYNLPAEAGSATLKIFDSNGTLIKTIEDVGTESGDNKVIWDFTDENGNKVPEGSYKFVVEAKTMDNKDMVTSLFKYGIIDGVRFTENGTKLVVDGTEYMVGDVIEISNNTTGG